MTDTRCQGIDCLKALAIWCVVCIHVQAYPTEAFNPVFTGLIHLGVPLFFMISGYFYQSVAETGGLRRWFFRTLAITVGATAFYALIEPEYIAEVTLAEVPRMIMLSMPLAGYHLWYLWAFLTVIAIMWVADRGPLRGRLVWLLPLLIVAHCLAVLYAPNEFFFRNGILTGLPYFLMGTLLRRSRRVASLNSRPAVTLVAIGVMLALLVPLRLALSYTPGSLTVKVLATLANWPGAALIFVAALALPYRRWLRPLAAIGRRYVTLIYVFHVAVLNQIKPLMATWPSELLIFKSIAVLAVTLAAAVILRRAVRIIRSAFTRPREAFSND